MTIIIAQKKHVLNVYDVPAGGEILYYGNAGDLPIDWSVDTALYEVFVMGADEGLATDVVAGSNSHTHSYSSNTSNIADHTHTFDIMGLGAATGSQEHYPTANVNVAPAGHTHSATYGRTSGLGGAHSHTLADTGSADSRPPFVGLYWIEASADAECPVNGIIVWNKILGDKPDGFVICDGLNGTPDMRDKFVYGAPNDAGVGSTGGATSHTHGNSDTNAAGSHTHTLVGSTGNSGQNKRASNYDGTPAMAAGNHAHSLPTGTITDTDANHTHTFGDTNSADSLPTYLKLYYLMRIK